MPKQVKNKKVTVPTDQLNDEDILNDMIMSFKHLVSNQATSLNEASNKKVYDEYFTIFTDTSNIQAKLFEMSWNKGWYILEEEDKTKVTQKYDEYSGKENEL